MHLKFIYVGLSVQKSQAEGGRLAIATSENGMNIFIKFNS
jgi:hypothetical protein